MKSIAFFIILLIPCTASANDLDAGTASASMQKAIQDEAANQSAFDSAYCQISQDAYLDIAQQVVVQKDTLLNALQATITQEKAYGNEAVVNALQNMLSYVTASNSTFSDDYARQIPSTSANTEADAAALQALQQTLTSDVTAVGQWTDSLEQEQAAQQAVAIAYLNGNPAVILSMANQVPDVADGTVATIFAIDAVHGCYFVNAGTYSGAASGTEYAITDTSGQYLGNIQLIRTENTYSVGILIHSSDIPLHAVIPDLLTKKTPPDTTSDK